MIASIHTAAKLNPKIVQAPVFDLSAAISSGAINEQQLIAVLTQLCRCVLAAQPTHPIVASELAVPNETASATLTPVETAIPAFVSPGVVRSGIANR